MDDNQSGDTPQAGAVENHLTDGRRAERTTALFRPALLETEDLHSFCLVRNISSSGMMVTLHASVEPGQTISIRFDEVTELKGRIVWHEDDRAGIEFFEPIDVAKLLVGLSGDASGNGSYRSPRLKIDTEATFIIHGESHAIEVQDISQRGMKGVVSVLREGDEGTVFLPGLQPRKAVTRWAKDGSAGFYFIDPIGFSELGQWILSLKDREQGQT